MFGNRAKISAEELAYMKEQLDNDRGFFENVNAKSKLIEADFDELEKSRQLQESSLKQLNDNANNVVEFSKDSMDAISALNDSFTECVKAAADNLTSLESAAKAIATQHEDTCALVENNKHFTAPAKSLPETSDRLEEHVDSCADIAAQMKEQNKQMSVLSLNAAIEAGGVGGAGRAAAGGLWLHSAHAAAVLSRPPVPDDAGGPEEGLRRRAGSDLPAPVYVAVQGPLLQRRPELLQLPLCLRRPVCPWPVCQVSAGGQGLRAAV